MKKIIIILSILLAPIITLGSSGTYRNLTSTEFDFYNQKLNGTPISTTFFNATDYNSLDFTIGGVSSGTLVTANIIWQSPSGVTLVTETLRSGIPINRMISNIVTVQIKQQQSATVNVTGNIIIAQKLFQNKRKILATLKFSVNPTSTSITVTQNMQGYWMLRSTQKTHISFPTRLNSTAPTATTAMFFLNADDFVDLGPIYFTSGEIVKMIANTVTSNVYGEVYE